MGKIKTYDHIIKYKVMTQLVTPMHIGASFGMGNEVLIHPVDGLPFVQASSIAGVIRGYYEGKCADKVKELFGSGDADGNARIVFSDGHFSESIRYEMRPRVNIDPVSGTTGKSQVKGTGASSGHKFDMECIAAGTNLTFEVYIKADNYAVADGMLEAFSALNSGAITLGGQKSNGFGNVRITSLLEKRFNLRDESDFSKWLHEEDIADCDYEEKLSELKECQGFAYRICLKGMTESGILVKGYKKEGFGEKGVDAISIQDANGNYIIPGSSIKGSIRNQITRILTYKSYTKEKLDAVIRNIFGEADSGGETGNIRVYDTVIKVPKSNELPRTNRIHIDKLTGGVMNQALFSEQKAFGNINICIDIQKKNDADKSCGYLILALRDLAANLYNLGGGYSVGNGMIKAEELSVQAADATATICVETGEIKDETGLIQKCIKATQEV